jgi:predicted nucleic acid-binding protein
MNPAPLVDTNILLRFAAQDQPEMAALASRLLSRIGQGVEQAELAPLAIFEAVFTLQTFYRESRTAIRDILRGVLSLDSLRFDQREVCEVALDIYASTNLSFADSYHLSYMRHHGITEIYSWDRGFDRFADITRIEPA